MGEFLSSAQKHINRQNFEHNKPGNIVEWSKLTILEFPNRVLINTFIILSCRKLKEYTEIEHSAWAALEILVTSFQHDAGACMSSQAQPVCKACYLLGGSGGMPPSKIACSETDLNDNFTVESSSKNPSKWFSLCTDCFIRISDCSIRVF